MQTLLLAHRRKRISGFIPSKSFSTSLYISSVFVTEAKPRGLGWVLSSSIFHSTLQPSSRIKTAELLTTAGIPCTVILDSAVAYAMDKVDFVLVGSEAVVESGGIINAIGSYQIAVIAKAANKPFYALAER